MPAIYFNYLTVNGLHCLNDVLISIHQLSRSKNMGDMAGVFNAMRQHKKESRAARLESTDDEGWEKHSPHHWYRIIKGKKVNYWPSSGLVMIGEKRMNINGKRMREMLSKETT